jgi:hypothetical protein
LIRLFFIIGSIIMADRPPSPMIQSSGPDHPIAGTDEEVEVRTRMIETRMGYMEYFKRMCKVDQGGILQRVGGSKTLRMIMMARLGVDGDELDRLILLYSHQH